MKKPCKIIPPSAGINNGVGRKLKILNQTDWCAPYAPYLYEGDFYYPAHITGDYVIFNLMRPELYYFPKQITGDYAIFNLLRPELYYFPKQLRIPRDELRDEIENIKKFIAFLIERKLKG